MADIERRFRSHRRAMSAGVVVALVVGGAVLGGCASDGDNTAPTRATTSTTQGSAPTNARPPDVSPAAGGGPVPNTAGGGISGGSQTPSGAGVAGGDPAPNAGGAG